MIHPGKDNETIGLKFVDDGDSDIPNEVYDAHGEQGEIHGREDPCKGLMIIGDGFGRDLCRQLGIRRMWDQMMVVPDYYKDDNMLILDLKEAKRVKPNIDMNDFVLPTWQFEREIRELEEEDLEDEELEEEDLEDEE